MTEAIDRRAAERSIPDLLPDVLADPTTRALVVAGDTAPLAGPEHLLRVPVSQVPGEPHWAFLGRWPDGSALVAAVLPADAPEPWPAPAGWGSLRAVAAGLAAADADVFVMALSIGRWLRDAPYCPACGVRTDVRSAGWSRSCPGCGREHFPRTDPAVIVAVTDPRGERLLLGSNAMWDADRYSCFAGFVEAGESLEDAVHREVREEAGVDAVEVAYRGSQAWPYPRSLMVGFTATAAVAEDARPDGEEILDVRWFDRPAIAEALEGRSALKLPGASSISHRLIRDWLGGRP